MKAVKSVRFNDDIFADQTTRRGTKLTPNKKSGKQRHQLYQALEEQDEQELEYATPRESILDYIDQEEDDEL